MLHSPPKVTNKAVLLIGQLHIAFLLFWGLTVQGASTQLVHCAPSEQVITFLLLFLNENVETIRMVLSLSIKGARFWQLLKPALVPLYTSH